MLRTSLFKQTLTLLFVIAALDVVASIFYLHWTLWWFDIVLHFLAGAAVSMALIVIWQNISNHLEFNKLKEILMLVLGTLLIGLLWEIFELFFDITSFSDGIFYWRDTFSDLIMDICGGFFGALYSFKLLSKNV